MDDVKPPKQTRREKAAATRERMVRAAIDVFSEAGYVGARMSDIAERAGVAVQTIYLAFHTKPELLQACYDYAVLGPERLPPTEQPFWTEIFDARTGRAAVAAFVAGNVTILSRAATIDEVAKAALHEPEAAEVVTRSERLRREGYRTVAERLAERFGLRPTLDVDTATDLLLMFGGGPTYLTLHRYGWSDEAYISWLTDTLTRQLLAKPGR